MSYITKETKSGGTQMQAIVVVPSSAQFSDIPELQHCNRWANEPKENADELMRSIKAREEIVTPLKGYIENNQLMITNGSRRMGIAQQLEAEGTDILLPVVLIKKPTTPEEVANAVLDTAADNNFRADDSPSVLHSSFSVLRKMGMGYQAIGEATGFSHQHVYCILKSFDIPPLKKAILDGLSPRVASEFFTKQFYKIDPKTKQPVKEVEEVNGKKVKVPAYDIPKIEQALKDAKAQANKTGGKIGAVAAKAAKSGNADNGQPALPGVQALKIILDEPQDNIPTMFRMFARWCVGKGDDALSTEGFKKAAKKNGFYDEVEFLFSIEFDPTKRKAAKEAAKAAREKAKATSAKATKKSNPLVAEDEELDADEYE
jgi:hypothetical protein